MKFDGFWSLLIICFALGVCVTIINSTVKKQQQQINQLTERVLLLENALADQSGVKK